MIAITLTVAAIPEGIPLCVTISQATGCSDMVKQNVLVTQIAAVETLGSASVICSDKTGTLTEGKMRAVKLWAGGVEFNISGQGFDPTKGDIKRADNEQDGSSSMEVRSTLLAALLCSNARVERMEENGDVQWVPCGNSSEVPIIVAAGKIGIKAEDMEKGIMESSTRTGEIYAKLASKLKIWKRESWNHQLEQGRFTQKKL